MLFTVRNTERKAKQKKDERMVKPAHELILLCLKYTVDIFDVGLLGQMFHKYWKFTKQD